MTACTEEAEGLHTKQKALQGVVTGLASELSTCWASSCASPELSAALRRLLPNLKYCSVAVLNPASGALVSSSNFASPGPTTLRLLEPAHSLAGICLAARRPLSTGLEQRAEGDESGTFVWHLDDVQAMIAESEAEGGAAGCEVRHLLCVPFGAAVVAEGEAPQRQQQRQQQQRRRQQQGGQAQAHHHEGRGAIVLGFPSCPELSPRRSAMLGMVADCLSRVIMRAAVDTLACVNYMCGAEALTCACCASSDEEEEGASGAGGPCREDEPRGGDPSQPPAEALAVPPGEGGCRPAEGSERGSGGDGEPHKPWKQRQGEAAAAAAAPAAAEPSTSAGGGEPAALGALLVRAAPRWPSKALLGALGPEGLAGRRSRLWLRFDHPALEREFVRWQGGQLAKLDWLFCLTLLLQVAILAFMQPYSAHLRRPWALIASGVCVAPLAAAAAAAAGGALARYLAHREALVAATRLWAVAFINLVCLPAYQAALPPERLHSWPLWALLTGAESLLVTALGLQVRLQLHVPLQVAALALASLRHPATCAGCFGGVLAAGACRATAAATAATAGLLLPSAVLHRMEARSRSIFLQQLWAAAGPA